jgi:hypothetical protein
VLIVLFKKKGYTMKQFISLFFAALFLLSSTACNKVEEKIGKEKAGSSPSSSSATSKRETMRASAKAQTDSVIDKKVDSVKIVDLTSMAVLSKKTVQVKGKVVEKVRRRKFNDFYAMHLGLPIVKNGVEFSDYQKVSFDANMATLWQGKVLREDVSGSTLDKAPELLANYLDGDKRYTTLPKFIQHTDAVVAKAKKSLNWKNLCKTYGFESKSCTLLQQLVADLNGKSFVAYGMTELFPGDANLNVLYLNMLLKNAGTSYIEAIPAMHDDMLSFGFYQFTSLALRKDDHVIEGTSIVNEFVKSGGYKIPSSVAYLKGDDHHVAAVYFAVHNLANMVALLTTKGEKLLSSKHGKCKEEMVMFVASAHHLPYVAWKKTAEWVNGGMKSGLIHGYPKSINLYAQKTRANLRAL